MTPLINNYDPKTRQWDAAALAFTVERGRDRRLLPLLIPQRFIYRQVMSYVAIRAVLAATKGQQCGWGWSVRGMCSRRWRQSNRREELRILARGTAQPW